MCLSSAEVKFVHSGLSDVELLQTELGKKDSASQSLFSHVYHPHAEG